MEVKVTPNRGDTLSMIGLGREVAALAADFVRYPAVSVPEGRAPVSEKTRVDVEAPDLCPRYAARVITDVKVGPSPEWITRRLEAAGLRSVNNVVDVTNYVMLEYGQPLHAFDYDLLEENRIVVRRARAGESITTIDGTERALPSEALVIADAGRAVAVAGVMGGLHSEISDATTTVLLESAAFDALSIRRTAKALGMSTDSSYRFERGVDPNGVVAASNRAAQLLAELAGGTVASGVVDVYPAPVEPWSLTLRPDRCNAVLGTQFAPAAMVEALDALQFHPEGQDPIRVTIPTWRPDIRREDDLAEEVGRMLGYDLIPAAPPRGQNLHGGVSAWGRFHRKVHQAGIACGWQEAVTSTLIEEEKATALGCTATARLSNPLSREINVIRPSLLPGLVDVIRQNLRHGRGSLGFFEVGRTYHFRDGAPSEATSFAAAVLGPVNGPSWASDVPITDFFSVKGALDAVLDHLNTPPAVYTPEEITGFHPGRAARVSLTGHPIGVLGELHPALAERWDIGGRLILFEVDVAALHHASQLAGFHALPRFPGVARDISFVTDRAMPQARIAEVITEAAGALLTDLTLFDVYRGDRLGEEKQSMAYRLSLRAEDRTLSDAEATETLNAVRAALTEQLGVTER
jgi:phenylalanyl-tRNA synthetase beta chain